MKIDLTCPVELWQSAMPAEDVSECTFVLNNLSHKVVVSLSSDAELLTIRTTGCCSASPSGCRA